MLNKLFEEIVKNNGHKVAIECDDLLYTYNELYEKVLCFSQGLMDEGIKKGDKIAVILSNSWEYIALFFAIARLGAIIVPLPWDIKEEELKKHFIFDFSLLFLEGKNKNLETLAKKKVKNVFLVSNHSKKWSDFSTKKPSDKITKKSALIKGDFIYLLSSASTDHSKYIVRTQENYLFEATAFSKAVGLNEKDKILCSLPLYHSHGIGSCLLPGILGGCGLFIFNPKNNAKYTIFLENLNELSKVIKNKAITIFPSISYVFQLFINDKNISNTVFNNVRYCFSSSAPLMQETFVQFKKRYGIPIRQIYGSTEAGAIAINTSEEVQFDTVGALLDGIDYKTIDDNNTFLPLRHAGEIVIKSPGLSARVYLSEEDNNNKIDGYFKTGDLGYVKENQLFLTGRKKIFINSGGRKIDPEEVEKVLMQHKNIDDAAVFGVSINGRTTLIKSKLVLNKEISKEEVVNFCKKYVSTYKIPKIISFCDTLPRNNMGKLLRKKLLEEKEAYILDFSDKLIRIGLSLENDVSFEDWGLDSINALEVIMELEEYFGPLKLSLLFKFKSMKELYSYFYNNYKVELENLIKVKGFKTIEMKSSNKKASFVENKKHPVAKQEEGIAIIGINGIYPGAENLEDFFNLLKENKSCISTLSLERQRMMNSFQYSSLSSDNSKPLWGGFLKDVDAFDEKLFNISPSEAEKMDPQERLFLQVAWATLEDAGYNRSFFIENSQSNHVAVFVGTMWSHYQLHGLPFVEKSEEEGLPKSSLWSIANRVSHFFNFTGPSMAVDSACSSSATAIHLACQSLLNGESSMALAGGVNLMLHAYKHDVSQEKGFISENKTAHILQASGDGYLPSEGVGAVLLKPLSQAEADGDPIYAVIKGSVINHSGRTTNFHVPSSEGQVQLTKQLLEKAHLVPDDIHHIELNSNGSAIGDLLEIEAFNEIFKDVKKNSCALGTIKSNIGHLEAASTIAALTKVIFQFKNNLLTPSHLANEKSTYVDDEHSPFYFPSNVEVLKNKKKTTKKDAADTRYSIVNAVGAGGSNGQLLIENYHEQKKAMTFDAYPFVFSAKNLDALMRIAENFLRFLENNHEFASQKMADIAYTLQVGREPLEERMAFIATSVEDCKEKLKAFLANKKLANDCYHDNIKLHKKAMEVMICNEDMQETFKNWVENNEIKKLLPFWVKGLSINWHSAYDNKKFNRVSLPSYPFEKKKFWYSVNRKVNLKTNILLQKNTSYFNSQQFTSTFYGDEFFLNHHKVNGEKIFPAVAYIEMARSAIEKSLKNFDSDKNAILLKNLLWIQPITLSDKKVDVHISLLEKNDVIDFEVFSYEGDKKIQHSKGLGSCITVQKEIKTMVDIPRIENRMKGAIVYAEDCYSYFNKIGLQYGLGHQALDKVHLGDNESLAYLKMPEFLLRNMDEYYLHPSLLDAALQATAAFSIICGEEENSVSLPFSMQRVEIFNESTSSMFAWVKRVGSGKNENQFDIDLLNDKGELCVTIKGFVMRKIPLHKKQTSPSYHMMVPFWDNALPHLKTSDAEKITFLCNMNQACISLFKDKRGNDHVIAFDVKDKAVEKNISEMLKVIFSKIKTLLKDKIQQPVIIQCIALSKDKKYALDSLYGLLKTAHLENHKIIAQFIEVEESESPANLLEKVNNIASSCETGKFSCTSTDIKCLNWQKLPSASTHEYELPWKTSGVYLITGGVGGLGLIFAQEIIAKSPSATLILVGRSPLSDEKTALLNQLRRSGAVVEYQQVDLTNMDEVNKLVNAIKTRFTTLNGIIHSAGVIKDNRIVNKTFKECSFVLAPKVTGLLNLHHATQKLPLDLFVLFSSISGSLGNFGQCDYAVANAFMDNFAAIRNDAVAKGECYGQTLAINWPLWEKGGMTVDEQIIKYMFDKNGLVPLDTASGLKAFYAAVATKKNQVMILKGDFTRIKATLLPHSKQTLEEAPISDNYSSPVSTKDEDPLVTVRSMISQLLKIQPEDIDEDGSFDEYGFDSITLTTLASKLSKHYGIDIFPTVFFECTTIQSFIDYLTAHYPNALRHRVNRIHSVKTDSGTFSAEPQHSLSPLSKSAKTHRVENELEPIAIVGMSGCFPMAANIETFWENLLSGKDCIQEIPSSRWDWRAIYGDPKKEVNKTNIKWGGFIDDIAGFDGRFFGISPREAELLDPQQRLLMMHVWHALEDAACAPSALWGSNTGVFVGTVDSHYRELTNRMNVPIEGYYATGTVPSVGPNRISYLLNLRGPSEPIETACSSSLVAIHRAVAAIRRGDCQQALVGGVNTLITPETFISFSKAGMLSEEGHCYTFSEKANGYVRGEGIGVLFLKKLSIAEEEGDAIHGIIRHTTENHGGRSKSLTAPNPKAQAELLEKAYSEAGIDPETVSFIEAHGTGTPLGDPIEINGLKMAFQNLYKKANKTVPSMPYCGISSAKSNIGHLEVAAGMAGVIKVLLQMKHGTLVKSLNCEPINPYIDLNNTPFFIVKENKPWEMMKDRDGHLLPRRAGVNSFGFGGVNAHVVVEEYLSEDKVSLEDNEPALIVLSAKTKEQLHCRCRDLLKFLDNKTAGEVSLASMAYTLQVGRDAMEFRLASIVLSKEMLIDNLRSYLKDEEIPDNVHLAMVKNKQNGKNKEINYSNLYDVMSDWLRGYDIAWSWLYHAKTPKKLHLPTYPFSLKQYWLSSEYINVNNTMNPSVTVMTEEMINHHDVAEAVIHGNQPILSPNEKNTPNNEIMDLINDSLLNEIAQALKIEPSDLSNDEPLADYGLDSIVGVSLVHGINTALNIDLAVTALFDFETINELKEYIYLNFKDIIASAVEKI
ncbi:MAG: SDR family NAD(P)-dependent oxidoreductase [Gammaproteobacteria bacterium]